MDTKQSERGCQETPPIGAEEDEYSTVEDFTLQTLKKMTVII